MDDQLKIRGYRVELGEIRSILNQKEDIDNAVVTVWEETPLNKKIVVYIVPKDNLRSSFVTESSHNSTSGESFFILGGEAAATHRVALTNYLLRFLPEYMMPTFFIYIDKIPITRNGKIDYKAMPAPNLNVRTTEESYVAPKNSMQQILSEIWSEVLKIERISIHDNFFRIGGDSIISIQLVSKARLRETYFTIKDIFEYPTIAALSAIAQKVQETPALKPNQNPVLGEVPLSPIQQWFFISDNINKNHYNQSVLLELSVKIDLSTLNHAFAYLVSHHDALRFRYVEDNNKHWSQNCSPIDALQFVDNAICDYLNIRNLYQALEEAETEAKFIAKTTEEASRLQRSLNISEGPVFKALLFDYGPGKLQRLLIVAHHLVIDSVSWRILLDDLERIYSDLIKGNKKSTILTKTHSYEQWVLALKTYADSEELKAQILYWQKIEQASMPLPLDFHLGSFVGKTAHCKSVSLSAENTVKLLQQVPRAYRSQINDILLTALVLAIGDWTGKYVVSLNLEGHGRQDIIPGIDLSRTVGWFTSSFPVLLEITDAKDLGNAIKTIKETVRSIPDKGVGFGVLRYLTTALPPRSSSKPALNFNYLGQWDNTTSAEGLFKFSTVSAGNDVSDENEFPSYLDINCEVKEGQFHCYWTYSSNHYQAQTIERLSQIFTDRIIELISHCCNEEIFGYTSSDFPLAKIMQKSLDENFGHIAGIEDLYPLSPMQSGLLFQTLFAPTSDAYFVQSVIKLEGLLDASILQLAWQKVSEARSILRTGFLWEGMERPLQFVIKNVEIPFTTQDWRDIGAVEQEQRLAEFIKGGPQKAIPI